MAAAEARRRSAVWALLPLLLRLLHPVALVLANTEGWPYPALFKAEMPWSA
ncbi:hypothetical protein ZEAMMB73_Zm00001d043484 [Zea mays]|uniref:Uncharacterized protein n=1 Tax=Zea mays TaxID=4577 RepID=A0A1D6NCK2_MAIZE|nr:hypothetical protein ZEAMMB73_Zm00001d043484 [Zea mays]